jgi:tripartite-type tricarboxylate transporter receptor subunit TctC
MIGMSSSPRQRRHLVRLVGACAAWACAAVVAPTYALGAEAAKDYPSKPITLVVPYAAGGSSDTRARQVAQKISGYLGQTVIVDNKPGANGTIGTDFIARSAPDGYVIGVGNLAPLAVNKYLYAKLPFDPADLTPVALLEKGPLVLVVNAKSPYNSVADLVAAGKAKPGKLTFASAGNGGSFHLAGEMFEDTTAINLIHVPYRGGAPATNDMLAGVVDLMFDMLPSAAPHLKGTNPRMRALAIASARRNPLLPEVPTFAELGIKNMEISNWFGIVAPKGTPPAIVAKLNAAINRALAEPSLKDTIISQGNEVGGGTPQEFGAFIAAESARWGKLIKEKNIKAE